VLKANKVLRIDLLKKTVSVTLSQFSRSGNEHCILLDTGCILQILRRLPAFVHKLQKEDTVSYAITEQVINETAEHLRKGATKNPEMDYSTREPSGIYSFMEILADKRIIKIADPEISRKNQLKYKEFAEDILLVYTLVEGGFKGLATQDGKLTRRLKGKNVFPC
jgi:rRNA-processing protein FCF1